MNVKFYQVGGSVRDSMLGIKSKDIDYAVEAPSYNAMRQSILDRDGKIFLETPQYVTIRALIPNLGACDFTLCRKESEYNDGRHPDLIEGGTLLEDLARRDFTINAMALDEDGNLVDPFNGKDDLRLGILRCVGDPVSRFTEDGLRIIRAVRFSITKILMMHGSIKSCLHNPDFFIPRLRGVSAERVREELLKCFSFSTLVTLWCLADYPQLTNYIFTEFGVWLKPTLESK